MKLSRATNHGPIREFGIGDYVRAEREGETRRQALSPPQKRPGPRVDLDRLPCFRYSGTCTNTPVESFAGLLRDVAEFPLIPGSHSTISSVTDAGNCRPTHWSL